MHLPNVSRQENDHDRQDLHQQEIGLDSSPHGKDYAKRYEVQEVELGTNEWIILEKATVVTASKPERTK